LRFLLPSAAISAVCFGRVSPTESSSPVFLSVCLGLIASLSLSLSLSLPLSLLLIMHLELNPISMSLSGLLPAANSSSSTFALGRWQQQRPLHHRRRHLTLLLSPMESSTTAEHFQTSLFLLLWRRRVNIGTAAATLIRVYTQARRQEVAKSSSSMQSATFQIFQLCLSSLSSSQTIQPSLLTGLRGRCRHRHRAGRL
jgi:hypothetical protein